MPRPIDKNSPVPAYYQIQKVIIDKIEQGEWVPKTQIPSERELTEMFDVSRMTLRHALQELVVQGFLVKQKGLGTFVAEPRIAQKLTSLTSFSEDMLSRGKKPSSEILEFDFTTVDHEISVALSVPLGESVVVVKRLRFADNEPMAIERAYLYFPGCDQIVRQDFENSIYTVLKQKFDLFPTRAHQKMRADHASKDECALLSIPNNTPILRLNRVTFDQNERPFEYTRTVYRGDKYVFVAELES
ncbi:MAG: GntR family transcriptional regulator [Anaerolineaceae bacterium]|nr:GntR family transcriptional regulator [Anaerolineaceae bacterium]